MCGDIEAGRKLAEADRISRKVAEGDRISRKVAEGDSGTKLLL